jgi:hypothetical protein
MSGRSAPKAFSSEVDTGSREENASKQESSPVPIFIGTGLDGTVAALGRLEWRQAVVPMSLSSGNRAPVLKNQQGELR